jgi:hypothetical protein
VSEGHCPAPNSGGERRGGELMSPHASEVLERIKLKRNKQISSEALGRSPSIFGAMQCPLDTTTTRPATKVYHTIPI